MLLALCEARLLASSMPPLCRAFLPTERQTPLLPSYLVASFVDQTIDAFIRRSLASTPLSPLDTVVALFSSE